MRELPMFPLGTVLLPGMPLALRVFEPRYLDLMAHVMAGDGTFGVVLIERGSEVGGGDARFSTGTAARIVGHTVESAWLEVRAFGTRRFEVDAWLPEEPYPRAEVRWLPDLEAGDADVDVEPTVEAVTDALTRAHPGWTWRGLRDEVLAGDVPDVAWRLARLAPVGPLDQLHLLRSASVPELLERTRAAAAESTGLFAD